MRVFEPDTLDYTTFLGFLDPSKDKTILRSKHNQCLTAALFLERILWPSGAKEGREVPDPIYTLGEWGKDNCVSAYQIFMNSLDEYEAAMKIVGSMYHWEALCQKKWFYSHLVIWRKHLAMRDMSAAKKTILRDAREGDGPSAKKIMDLSLKVLSGDSLPKPKKVGKTVEKEERSFDELMKDHLGD